ncbi:hypothetical protein WPG_2063 [Winogradskyella sp. PG-2]|nr:hypothetical protein WPG_2063 [Winogradskyella sp. PG-2]
MFGQLPEVQIVFSLYLSTRLLSSVYFLPVGNFTRSHFGLRSGKIFEATLVSMHFQFQITKIRSK